LLCVSLLWSAGEVSRPELSSLFPEEYLSETLPAPGAWNPFPRYDERSFWQELPQRTIDSQLQRAEKNVGQPWPELPATLYMEFATIGNRSNYETSYFERRTRLADLVLAECMEGKGRFTGEIVNGLWLILEESSWTLPAHIGAQRAGKGLPDRNEPIVALFSAETSGLIAWTIYLLEDQLDEVSPLIVPHSKKEVKERILDPCLERDDFWWMSFNTDHINNWNPWVNSNWLASMLLLEDSPQRRSAAAAKIMRSLDRFTGSYHDDGGCDEGPSYWGRAGASLFDCLEWFYSASNGKIDVYDYPLIKNMGRYIYRAHIDGRWFINFADASAKVGISHELVWRYGKRIEDKLMENFGGWAAHSALEKNPAPSGFLSRRLWTLANIRELMETDGSQPFVRDVWLDGIEVMAARSQQGSADGFYLAAKGGHNNESHNHNDIGNYLVYYNGQPILVDAGVGVYTAKTFSNSRYEIWTMQSAYHNLPTVNGAMQQPGREFAARDIRYHKDNRSASLSLELAGAYPKEAGIKSWKRKISLQRGQQVMVEDAFSLTKRDGKLMMSLITPCMVKLGDAGVINLDGNKEGEPFSVKVRYDKKLRPEVETLNLADERLKSSWGNVLYRITLHAENDSPLKDKWTVRVTH
jgi:hypothetical protein